MRRRRRDDTGVTTVEFALVLPIFIFLIGIATYFSWMFFVQSQVDRAADRASRYAAVGYTTETIVQQNIDPNGNIIPAGATGITTVSTYTTTQTTTTYHYCVPEVVAKVNRDLASGSITSADVVVSDGSGVLAPGTACAKPNGYVKVQVHKNFTNPFSVLLAPFTGGTDELTVTGTGRARVEAE
jgi:Flp pilus assembly protein TadG